MTGRGTAARTLISLLLAVAGFFGLVVAPVVQARAGAHLLSPYLTPGPLPVTLMVGLLATGAVAVGAKRTAVVLSLATLAAAGMLVREWGLPVLAAAGGSALAILVGALLVPRLAD